MAETQTIVAVDIGGTKIACGLVTLGGDAPVIEKVQKVPTEAMEAGRTCSPPCFRR